MGQVEVLSILEKAKKPLPGTEIARLMGDRDKHVFQAIKKLLKSDDIKCIEIDRHQAMELYHCKRRMRLYYIGSRSQ